MVCQVFYQQRRRDFKNSQPARAPGDDGSGVAEASNSSQSPASGRADVVVVPPKRYHGSPKLHLINLIQRCRAEFVATPLR